MKPLEYSKKFNESIYDLEIKKVLKDIEKAKAKTVLLQFPDGLKPFAKEVVDEIQSKCKGVRILIWFGTCYGACDLPLNLKGKVDLVVQFGHNRFVKNVGGWR